MAMIDNISHGRLECGFVRGVPYELFASNAHPTETKERLWESIDLIIRAWTSHDGPFNYEGRWTHKRQVNVWPRPYQQPHPPIWVAARSPITFDYAVANGCNVMSWPIARPFAEAELYKEQLDASIAASPGAPRPTWALMRHTAVYGSVDEWMVPVEAAQRQLSQFENLFKNLGDVQDGFPAAIPMAPVPHAADYEPTTLSENLLFGTPEEVIAKLRRYEALGVDEFIYYASLGLGLEEQKRSMQLFCDEVIPAFK